MGKIDGKTKVLGLLGNPVAHTLSPVIHNSLAKELDQNVVYLPFQVEEDGLEEAIRGAFQLGIEGLNVTVPYKTKVMKYLMGIDETAQKIGAVNTLVRKGKGYYGYNTDAMGLKRQLLSEGILCKDAQVIVLGAGGAAKAVLHLLVKEGARTIYLLNRSMHKAQEMAEGIDIVKPMLLEEYQYIPEGKYLAIQCTSVGLHPDVDQAVIEDDSFYQKIHTGVDLVYRPQYTKFMRLVEKNGGKAYNGLKMLLYQGVSAYELFRNITISEDVIGVARRNLESELEKNE